MGAVTAAESREERLERLVRMHQGMLLRLCYVCLRDMELARDATQETFLKVYRKLDGFWGKKQRKDLAVPYCCQHLECDLSRINYSFFQ